MFALASRSARAIASPTSSGTCEPPGASRKTKPSSRSEEKRARTASTSNRVAAMKRAYPRVLLGCGNFGGIGSAPAFFGHGETVEQALELMDAAWEAGITWFDTADAYGGGRSEMAIGRWIASRGVRPALTTKTYNPMRAGADHGLSPGRISRQLAGSLERLGVDRVELYLAHEFDPDVPLEATFGRLEQARAHGHIQAYGVSNFDAGQLAAALAAG